MKYHRLWTKAANRNRYRDDPWAGFLFSWEFWLSYGVFGLVSIFGPWELLTKNSFADYFTFLMASLVPKIEPLPPEAVYRPIKASKLQLSFVHFVTYSTIIVAFFKLKPHYGLRLQPRRRLVALGVSGSLFLFLGIFFNFLFLRGVPQESIVDNSDYANAMRENWYGNKHEVFFQHSLMMAAPLWVGLALAKGTFQETIHRISQINKGN
jgi:hypothetical protein